MEEYCNNLNIFNSLKEQFFKDAFVSTGCANNTIQSCIDADNLYNFTIENDMFIKNMKRGCRMGGNTTACCIGTSGVNDILSEFNYSYHNYKKNPQHLCSAFSEYANNELNLFITGGCYLYENKINKSICDYTCSNLFQKL